MVLVFSIFSKLVQLMSGIPLPKIIELGAMVVAKRMRVLGDFFFDHVSDGS